MDLLISMKQLPTRKQHFLFKSSPMQISVYKPKGFFIAEFREADFDKLKLLRKYTKIIKEKLNGYKNYSVESTPYGFIIKREVDTSVDYMIEWEGWVDFSWNLHDEMSTVIRKLLNEKDPLT